MGKQVLLLTGSPRRGGNSDQMAQAFCRGAQKSGHQVSIFETAHAQIGGCRACDTCWSTGHACSFEDDFRRLEPLLEQAEVLVLCTPLYWFGFPVQLKAAIDKLYAYMASNAKKSLPIRESLLLICGADEDPHVFEGAVKTYRNIAQFMNWQDNGALVVPAVQEKTDIAKTGMLLQAEQAGENLSTWLPADRGPKTEKEKMLAGELYLPYSQQLAEERLRAKQITRELNLLPQEDETRRMELVRELFGQAGENAWAESPFQCDYGYNITVGDNFYANHGCVILDAARVSIGDNVMLAPQVGIYTAGHPLDPKQRAACLEYAKPVTIGDNVWIGGGVTIVPGVTIGSNSVIGAGSVVTKDIPANVLAVGNPCRVLRPITEADRLPETYGIENLPAITGQVN